MGYRSNVKIAIPFNLLKDLNEKVQNKINEDKHIQELMKKHNDGYSYNMLEDAKIKTDNKTYCILSWNWIKFYEDYADVRILLDALNSYGTDEGAIYNICEIGEDGQIIRENNDNFDIPSLYTISTINYDEEDEDEEILLQELLK